MRLYQNYHKHSMYTNARVPDSVEKYENYAKRAKELGHGIISSVEHGWQGRYIECYEMAKKYDLKFLFGTEAYWVKDRLEKDDTNAHICILAKNENGRQAINDILAEANISGFYYKPRIDLNLIFSLPTDDVIITTACTQFWQYEDIDEIILRFKSHFKHFYLEVQYHNTKSQKELNLKILNLSTYHKIPLIMGCDSHYISEENAWERTEYLASKYISYDHEDGWFMDYPDGDTAFERFVIQGILNEEQINEAMENTNIFLDIEEYESPIFNKEIKMPTLYPELSQKQKDNIYKELIKQKWREIKHKIPEEKYDLYKREITKEVNDVITTKHSDYFLYDYELVKRAVAQGGMITNSGRGSGVSYYTNKLLGFTKIDRISAKVKMYPERFISPTRILQTASLADLDLNLANPELFARVQKEMVGEDHAYPMLAYGKFKAKSAFKMYARAKNLDFELANEISQQIEEYEKALKYAEDDEKEDINIYDYIDEKYHELITDSESYLGIISDIKQHPCGHLIYQGNIRKEIGLIKIKTESTKKETICSIMDGKWAEEYKFLKNDLLKVDVVKLIKSVYKRIGISEHDEQELISICANNQKVWDIYKYGYTMGINQIEKTATKHKAMRYQPKNISELCAFVAGVRPAFKSMYDTFEKRKHFEYGIKAFDSIIQTEEMPDSFILYQEQIMATLNFAGVPMSECYEVIKNISKKREEKVKKYKDIFLEGFANKIMEIDQKTKEEADSIAHDVWTIINNSCQYGFNASHAYSVAIDSLYGAYLKSAYPLYFYEVFLNLLFEKGNAKDRIALTKQEATKGFGIKFTPMRFGQDNRKFTADEKTNSIYSAMSSIKDMGKNASDELYELRNNEYLTFVDLLVNLREKTNLNKSNINTLIKLNYFITWGNNLKLLKIAEAFNNRYDKKHTEKTKVKRIAELKELESNLENNKLDIQTQLIAEYEVLDYAVSTYKVSENVGMAVDIDTENTPKIKFYMLATGEILELKIYRKNFFSTPSIEIPTVEPLIHKYDIIQLGKVIEREKNRKVNDEWIPTGEYEKYLQSFVMIKKYENEVKDGAEDNKQSGEADS